MKKECDKCGAIYSLSSRSLPMRDKFSIQCKYCGETIISWNGGHEYIANEISGPTKDYKKL